MLAGLATVAVCAVLTGLVVLIGTVSGPVIIVLVLAGTPWVRRGLHRVSRPLPAVGDEPVLHKLEPNPEVPRSHVVAADLSTAEFCLAWRRSYLVLIETPYGAGHDEVVCWRRALLDELELRDHAGFDRWIVTGAGTRHERTTARVRALTIPTVALAERVPTVVVTVMSPSCG